jgi:AI-2 transport protein TqsA
MDEPFPSRQQQVLQVAAYVAIVAWGIRTASHILSVVLLALLVAYILLPFPRWLMRRFRLRKSLAIVLTAVLVTAFYVATTVVLIEAGSQFRAKLPIYEERITSLDDRVGVFLSAHGVQPGKYSVKNLYSSGRIIGFASAELPTLIGLISDRLLMGVLTVVFVIVMTYTDNSHAGLVARKLVYYGADAQHFIAITARTGAIIATANLVLLVVFGVDFAVVWCFLYFFFQFIPSIGFMIALVPPSLIALLMLGWKTALLVAGGLILTQMVGDYVISPMLMKKGLHVSFLEIMLSLVIWSFLLGPAGALLGMPLTLAVRRLIERPFAEVEGALAQMT